MSEVFSCLGSTIVLLLSLICFVAKFSFLISKVTRVLLGLSQRMSLECECLDWLIELCEACSSPVLTLVGQRVSLYY